MKNGEECGYCRTLLDAHCTLHGPQFCEIKDRYYSDDTMGIDDVYDSLLAIATPVQIEEATRAVNTRQAAGLPPVPVVDTGAAQAAAQRWLTHWQQGK